MKKFTPVMPILSALSLSLLLGACGNTAEKSDKLQVFTSFYAVYDFTRTIGGDDIELYNIAPVGAEPHDFEPSAKDIARLCDADVFIYNGAGMDGWAEDVAETLPSTVTAVCTSKQVETDGSDPHVWLSPYLAQIQMREIYRALSTADNNGENTAVYLERLTEYSARIDKLEQEYENADLRGKKLFVTHGAYGYLCADFGMEQIALEGIAGDSDPSPAQMADIVSRIKECGAGCIFYDPLEGDKAAAAVAKEAGVDALPLYTFEGDPENRDYITIMELNLEQLKKGL